MTKLKILVLGPQESGKTRISNFLADATTGQPADDLVEVAVRILEFEVDDLKFNNENAKVDIELWDCSGNESFESCWPAIRRNANGVVFVYTPQDKMGIKKLDLWYNYFVTQSGLTPRQCIVFCNQMEGSENSQPAKLSSTFSKLSQVVVNLETASEKLQYDFNQFLVSVLRCL